MNDAKREFQEPALSEVTGRSSKTEWSAARDRVLITLPFYVLFLAQIAHHEIWRDEINAWTISYTSSSTAALLHSVHYEGHPALWYLILFVAGKLSHSLWMLKAVSACIGSATYYLFARYSPLGRIEHLLVLLSYYFVFEYTVLCRMYGLELFFALAYAHGRTRWPQRILRNTLWLCLMANVDVTGAICATGFLVEYVIAYLDDAETERPSRIRRLALSISFFLISFAIAVETLWPAKDLGWSTTGRLASHVWESDHLVQAALKWIAIPWVPRSINILDSWSPTGWPYFFFAPAILVLLYTIFRNHVRLGMMMVGIIVAGIFFSQITSVAGIRHTGVVFIAFVVCLWMLRSRAESVSIFAYVLLGLTAITGCIAITDQWSWPFSDTGEAATWIVQNHMQDMPLFGTPDTDMLAVPERLQRPFYQLECACVDRVLVFSKRRDNVDYDHAINVTLDVPARLSAGMQSQHVTDGLLIMTRALAPNEVVRLFADGVSADLLKRFTRGFLAEERIYIYRVQTIQTSTFENRLSAPGSSPLLQPHIP